MSVRLVLTADDLGYDPGTNATIAALLADGLVSASTLLTVAPDADDAVALVRRAGHTPAVHVALTTDSGHRWAPLSASPSLGGPGGPLPATAAELAGIDESVITAEVAAQWQWALDRGLAPTRLDSHAGTLYGFGGPSYLSATLTFCAEQRIGFRLPRRLDPYPGAVPEPLATRHAEAVRLADTLGVPLPDSLVTHPGPVDRIGGYAALRDFYLAALATLGPGTHELFLHPAADSATLRARCPEWHKRVWEHRLLRDPAFRDALTAHGIELVPDWAR